MLWPRNTAIPWFWLRDSVSLKTPPKITHSREVSELGFKSGLLDSKATSLGSFWLLLPILRTLG